jgi:hypothetical protein
MAKITALIEIVIRHPKWLESIPLISVPITAPHSRTLTTAPCAPIESLKSFLQKRQYLGNDTNVHSEKQTGKRRRESNEIDAKLFA